MKNTDMELYKISTKLRKLHMEQYKKYEESGGYSGGPQAAYHEGWIDALEVVRKLIEKAM